jgi:hypothetical protein
VDHLSFETNVADQAWDLRRSPFVNDPEMNTVEWVCYDETIG